MAKRRSKRRGKASAKSRRKSKRPMTAAAAKPAARRKARKAKSRRKVTGKAAASRTRKTAAMRPKPVIPVKTGNAPKADPANPLGITLPAMPFNYSRDSIMNVLVGMLILFAVVSAGIFYPQTTTTERALTAAPGVMQKK